MKIHSFYGTSEAGGICFDRQRPDRRHSRPSAGRCPGVTVTLVPGDGVPDGYGRIHVRSAAVARGYVGETGRAATSPTAASSPATTARSCRTDGWRWPGGSRRSSTSPGRKVQPGEVERVLQIESTASPMRGCWPPPMRSRGEQIAAVVAGGRGLSPADVRRYCARRLAPHKIPRIVVFVDAMPLTARGKTDHRALEALVAAHRSAGGSGVLSFAPISGFLCRQTTVSGSGFSVVVMATLGQEDADGCVEAGRTGADGRRAAGVAGVSGDQPAVRSASRSSPNGRRRRC